MKDNKVKERFVELRSQGLSFDKIGKELKTNRVTFMSWKVQKYLMSCHSENDI